MAYGSSGRTCRLVQAQVGTHRAQCARFTGSHCCTGARAAGKGSLPGQPDRTPRHPAGRERCWPARARTPPAGPRQARQPRLAPCWLRRARPVEAPARRRGGSYTAVCCLCRALARSAAASGSEQRAPACADRAQRLQRASQPGLLMQQRQYLCTRLFLLVWQCWRTVLEDCEHLCSPWRRGSPALWVLLPWRLLPLV